MPEKRSGGSVLDDRERRQFLKLIGAAATGAALPLSIQRALAIPANHRTGTIADVEHVVFLMKENRSFDHYFGTLRGVRGFGDPHPARIGNGADVFQQSGPAGNVLPFHPSVGDLGMRFLPSHNHSWSDMHDTWREGWYDQWVWQKGAGCMLHMRRPDIPFHYALADAFTVCDAYYSSLLGPTEPNRLYMFTGWVGNDGRGGGPVLYDTPKISYSWGTYAEQLGAAGVSWKVYQDTGNGMRRSNFWGGSRDPFIGTFGCNLLLYFKQVQNAAPGSELYERARTGTHVVSGGSLFQELLDDVRRDRLPQVSWIVAPEAYSEHPNWPANYGAWYTSKVLDALTSNPEVWSKTVLFLMYDENDGYFDHVVPPTPPMGPELGASAISTENALYAGSYRNRPGPYGLGVRVPMVVISPWSRGGWVSSEVFDHTSLIRFVEARFGVGCKNITPWRRAVCGDLTSAFDFATPNDAPSHLPSTAAFIPPDHKRHRSYRAQPPADQSMPSQEPGQRPARAVPYRLDIMPTIGSGSVTLAMENRGTATVVFQVRTADHLPRCYTVGPHSTLTGSWNVGTRYDLEVSGPNGFYRRLAGIGGSPLSEIRLHFDSTTGDLELAALPTERSVLTVRDAYTRKLATYQLEAGLQWRTHYSTRPSSGWYDLDVRCLGRPAYRRVLAGHVETANASASDPQFSMRRLGEEQGSQPLHTT